MTLVRHFAGAKCLTSVMHAVTSVFSISELQITILFIRDGYYQAAQQPSNTGFTHRHSWFFQSTVYGSTRSDFQSQAVLQGPY